MTKPTLLDFFAGSGLVSKAMSRYFETVWANDICSKKARIFQANFPEKNFLLGDIKQVKGTSLPEATVSWASFPCVDLSLAGSRQGLHGERSGLFFEWLRITKEMDKTPEILVIENVEGLITSNNGIYYRTLHNCLIEFGYKAGPLIIDAKHWVPQSRVRSFVIAVRKDFNTSNFERPHGPSPFHTASLLKATEGLEHLVSWNLPTPDSSLQNFLNIVELDAPVFPEEKNKEVLSLIPKAHFDKLMSSKDSVVVAPGYRRTRNGVQVLELRFDGLAGCLRVPRGGSSRQYVVIKKGNKLSSRLLTIKETSLLMGAPSSFKLPGSYNEAYGAMGDAVAFPVVDFLAKNLLSPLAKELSNDTSEILFKNISINHNNEARV